MNIKIKFKVLGLGYNDFFQAYIKIFDTNNNLIYEGYTYNSYLDINLCENTYYNVFVKVCSKSAFIPIYTNQDIFIFNLNRSTNRTITFILRDYFYNLPIKRGEITFE